MSVGSTVSRMRQLGNTGIEISPIGLGAWQFAGGRGFDRLVYEGLPQDEINSIVKAAYERGVNWFDTAEAYGWGRSERNLAEALRAAGLGDDEVVVATKWFPPLRTAESLGRTIVKRRRCLGEYSIDLYQVHQPTALASVQRQMDAMAELVDLGLVKSVGVSNFSAKLMRRAHAALEERGLPLASNQVKINLMSRHIEKNGILLAAKELGITLIAWSPLEMGLLTGKFHRNPELLDSRPPGRRSYMRMKISRSTELVSALEEIASAHGTTAGVVALGWIINFYGDTVVAIPGASTVEQVEQNAAAMDLKLSARELLQLDGLSTRFKRFLPLR